VEEMGSLKSLGERRLKKMVFVGGNGGGDGGEEGGGVGGVWCWNKNGEGEGLWWPAKSLVVVCLLLELTGNKGDEGK